MSKSTLISGKKTHKKYTMIELSDIVGKTIEAVVETSVPGPWGNEPMIKLLFSDGTEHGFVLPSDDD